MLPRSAYTRDVSPHHTTTCQNSGSQQLPRRSAICLHGFAGQRASPKPLRQPRSRVQIILRAQTYAQSVQTVNLQAIVAFCQPIVPVWNKFGAKSCIFGTLSQYLNTAFHPTGLAAHRHQCHRHASERGVFNSSRRRNWPAPPGSLMCGIAEASRQQSDCGFRPHGCSICRIAHCAAASRAIGTLYGEHDT